MTLNEAANCADTLREQLHGEFYSGEAELPPNLPTCKCDGHSYREESGHD
jgi:hypothetical protein